MEGWILRTFKMSEKQSTSQASLIQLTSRDTSNMSLSMEIMDRHSLDWHPYYSINKNYQSMDVIRASQYNQATEEDGSEENSWEEWDTRIYCCNLYRRWTLIMSELRPTNLSFTHPFFLFSSDGGAGGNSSEFTRSGIWLCSYRVIGPSQQRSATRAVLVSPLDCLICTENVFPKRRSTLTSGSFVLLVWLISLEGKKLEKSEDMCGKSTLAEVRSGGLCSPLRVKEHKKGPCNPQEWVDWSVEPERTKSIVFNTTHIGALEDRSSSRRYSHGRTAPVRQILISLHYPPERQNQQEQLHKNTLCTVSPTMSEA